MSDTADTARKRPGTIGPLDDGTLRPVRTLVTAKLMAMLVVAIFALGSAALLAPQVGSVLGFARPVQATVTELMPFDTSDAVRGVDTGGSEAACVREQVQVAWGSGRTGYFVTCAGGHSGADMPVTLGDTVTVRAVPGWDSVVVGDRWPNVIVVAVLAALVIAPVVVAMRYRRERAALLAAGARAVATEPLPVTRTGLGFAFDPLSFGKGKRATVRLQIDSGGFAPLRVQVPGTSVEAMEWRSAQLYPLGVTRAGQPTGPYALRPAAGGVIIASGRPLRAA